MEEKLAKIAYASTDQNKSVNEKPFIDSDYCTSRSIPAVENIEMIPSSSQINKGVKVKKPISKSYA